MKVRQKRAEQTRRRLLHAAAGEFSLHGYGGTSLQRISGDAGVTLGALTFHFPTKVALAGAVHAHGCALTREKARGVLAPHRGTDVNAPRLRQVIDLTNALTRLLHEAPTVRAAARLSRDRVLKHEHWNESWLPGVQDLLERADREGELRPGVTPDLVALLTRSLVSGMEESARFSGGGTEHLGELAAVWDVVLSGAAADGRRPR